MRVLQDLVLSDAEEACLSEAEESFWVEYRFSGT